MEKQENKQQTKSVSSKIRRNPLSFADRQTNWSFIIILLVKIFAKCMYIIKSIFGRNKVAFFNFLKIITVRSGC